MLLNKEGVINLNSLSHHGIIGMKWGVRRYQNKDGTLTSAGKKRMEQRDAKWAHKNYDKIVSKAKKSVSKELDRYANELLRDPSAVTLKGKLSSSTINAYNKKMSELMNESAKDIITPSGRVVQFVAKRGEVGVHMAIADRGYDMSQLKNGIWSSGRIAYKKKTVNVT